MPVLKNTLDELQEKESQLEKTCGIQTSVTHDFILFFKLCYKDIPKIQYSIKVASDLTVTVYLQGVQVKRSLVLEIASTNLNNCTTLNKLLSYLEAQPVQDITQGDILEGVIEKLNDHKFGENVKIDFIVEQLTLAFKSPNGRMYSPSLLAMSALLQRMSPTSYKQMYSDGFLTIPSPHHLRCLCSAFDINTMLLSDSTKAGLQARYQKFNEKEKIVSVLMDEVYCQRSVQYVNGQFYGVENETYTKTLLCVMLKSIAGKYRDIIVMMPRASISADILYQVCCEFCLYNRL